MSQCCTPRYCGLVHFLPIQGGRRGAREVTTGRWWRHAHVMTPPPVQCVPGPVHRDDHLPSSSTILIIIHSHHHLQPLPSSSPEWSQGARPGPRDVVVGGDAPWFDFPPKTSQPMVSSPSAVISCYHVPQHVHLQVTQGSFLWSKESSFWM